MSTMPVALARQGASRSMVKTLIVAAVAAACLAALAVFFVLPGTARAENEAAVALTRYDQTDEHIDYDGSWDTFEKSAAYKTAYDRTNKSGASVSIYFNGTRCDWIAMKGTSTGKGDVYLDGVFKKTINLEASSASYQVNVWSTGDLPAGIHEVTIVRSASSPAKSFLTLDAVDVAGVLLYGPPEIFSLDPVSGSTAGGASVVINGAEFLDATAVTFGGVPATSFSVDSSAMITAVAPAHAAGSVSVTVTTPSGETADTAADDYLYATLSMPVITSVSPATGAAGTTVVITGTGFIGVAGSDGVTFGGTDAEEYIVDSPTQITAVAPSRSAGKIQVKVKAAGGTTTDTANDDFSYLLRYDQTDSRCVYTGTWAAYSTSSAYKGSYGRSNTAGAYVTLTFTGTRLTWFATKGTTTGLGDVYVDGVFKQTVDLTAAAVAYQQEVWTTGDLSNGVHIVKIVRSAASASGKYLTIDAVDVTGTLLGGGRIEQDNSNLAFAGTWSVVSSTSASAGSYRKATGSSAAVYLDFTGVQAAWIATTGTTMGKAWVSVDGGAAQSVNLYSATAAYKQKVWDSGPLALGDHEIKIWWDSTNASSAYINVDAFDVLGSLKQAYLWHRHEQTDVRLLYTGTWSTVSASGAAGGSYKQTTSTAAYFDFLFTGRQWDWLATTGPGMGKADISIDGKAPVTVDLSGAALLYQQKVWTSPVLADGLHRVQITVSPSSPAGAPIGIDAIDVHGSLPSVSSESTAKYMWAEQRLKELSYMPGVVNGASDSKSKGAVIAFQKWEGLTRDGSVGTTVWTKLHTASRPKPSKAGTTEPWIEVNLTKQVMLWCMNGAVVYTFPVSTGSASVGMITPSGTFAIYSKTPPRGHLYYPMAITSAIAIHGYTTVPTQPASHGCVRTQNWDQDVIYPLTPLGTRVYIYY